MTKKELSQLYRLNREVENERKRLAELETMATKCTAGEITGLPKGSGNADKVARYAAEIADLKGIIESNIQRCYYELNRLNRYINSIDDSFIRQILTYRYISGYTWNQVAAHIDANLTGEACRKAHDRFLQQND